MKQISITKGPIVKTECPEDLAAGIVAFQLVNFTINFFGSQVETTHDTKIMKDGRQFVIGGCGFIGAGFEIQ